MLSVKGMCLLMIKKEESSEHPCAPLSSHNAIQPQSQVQKWTVFSAGDITGAHAMIEVSLVLDPEQTCSAIGFQGCVYSNS